MSRGYLVALILLTAAAHAQAGESDSIAAEALFRQGRVDVDAADFAAACPKFQASYRLEPVVGTLLSLADCEEHIHHLAAAWKHFHQLVDQLRSDDDRRSFVLTHAEQLDARVPYLRLRSKDALSDATLEWDKSPLDAALINVAFPVDPGAHLVVVHASGHADSTYEVTLHEGEHRDLDIAKGAAVVASGLKQSFASPAPLATRGVPLRTAGVVLLGLGLASGALGSLFGALALTDNSRSNASCIGSVCANQEAVTLHVHAQSEALIADIGIFGGCLLGVVGAGLLLATLHTTKTEVHLTSTASAAFSGITLGGSF